MAMSRGQNVLVGTGWPVLLASSFGPAAVAEEELAAVFEVVAASAPASGSRLRSSCMIALDDEEDSSVMERFDSPLQSPLTSVQGVGKYRVILPHGGGAKAAGYRCR